MYYKVNTSIHKPILFILMWSMFTPLESMQKEITHTHQSNIQKKVEEALIQKLPKDIEHYYITNAEKTAFKQNLAHVESLCKKGRIKIAEAVASIYKDRPDEYSVLQEVIKKASLNANQNQKKKSSETLTEKQSTAQKSLDTAQHLNNYKIDNGLINNNILPSIEELQERIEYLAIEDLAEKTDFLTKIEALKNQPAPLSHSDIDLVIAKTTKQYFEHCLKDDACTLSPQKLFEDTKEWKKALYLVLLRSDLRVLKASLVRNSLSTSLPKTSHTIALPSKDALLHKFNSTHYKKMLISTPLIEELTRDLVISAEELVLIVDENTRRYFYEIGYTSAEIENKYKTIDSTHHQKEKAEAYEALRQTWKQGIYEIVLEDKSIFSKDDLRARIEKADTTLNPINKDRSYHSHSLEEYDQQNDEYKKRPQ